MKKLVLIFLCLSVVVTTFAQKNKKKNEIDPRVKEILDSRNYKLDANMAFPNIGRSMSLDSRYGVEIKGDSLFSYLPYFGRAYRLPYGGGEGLIFDTKIDNYSSKPGKKGSILIKFRARTQEDVYTYTIVVFSNGNASINVSSGNKQSIDFGGEMNMEKK